MYRKYLDQIKFENKLPILLNGGLWNAGAQSKLLIFLHINLHMPR
jgi:hypothetical protein